jgi:uncharacterized protein DUF695
MLLECRRRETESRGPIRASMIEPAASFPWLGAKGENDGRPFVVRMRNVPLGHPLRPSYRHLLVATRSFDSPDGSGLPSDEQYASLAKYEEQVLALEKAGLGILAMIRTYSGTIEYVLYVADAVDAAVFLVGKNVQREEIALDAIEGDDWYEYDRTRARLRFVIAANGGI